METTLYGLVSEYFSLSDDWFNGEITEAEITLGISSLYQQAQAAGILQEWIEWHTDEMDIMKRFYSLVAANNQTNLKSINHGFIST